MAHILLLSGLLTAQALTLPQALAASEQAPAVTAQTQAVADRDALARETSGFVYNPVLQVQPGIRDPHASGPLLPEIYVTATQRFSAAGHGAARRDALDSELVHDQALLTSIRRRARIATARAWFTRWATQSAHEIAKGDMALLDEWARATTATFVAGEATQVDVNVVRGFRAEVALYALSIEGEMFDAGLELTRVIGGPAAQPTPTEGELPELALPPATQLDVTAVADAPEVLAARADHAAQATRLRETRAAHGTTFGLGAQAFREGGGDVAVLAMLEVDLPLFNGGQRERATAASDLARASGQAEQAQTDARIERARLLHELRHMQGVAELLLEQEAANEAVTAGQYQRWLAREATTQDLVVARRGTLQTKLARVRAQANLALARFLVAEVFGTEGGR